MILLLSVYSVVCLIMLFRIWFNNVYLLYLQVLIYEVKGYFYIGFAHSYITLLVVPNELSDLKATSLAESISINALQ